MSEDDQQNGAAGGARPKTTSQLDVSSEETRRDSLLTVLNTMDLEERRKTLTGLLDLCLQGGESTSTPRRPPAPITKEVHEVHEVHEVVMAKKLPRFSGKKPIPSGEVEFRLWYEAAQRLIDNKKYSQEDKKEKIFDSLGQDARKIAESVGKQELQDIINFLNNWYGSTKDGTDHLYQFNTMTQSPKEESSEYFQRLYLQLSMALTSDAIRYSEVPAKLVKHFIRTCDDEHLIDKLKLEELQDNPPPVTELLMDMRKIEARRTERKLRHRASVKAITSDSQPAAESNGKGLKSQMSKLEKELQQMKIQLSDGKSPVQQDSPVSVTVPDSMADIKKTLAKLVTDTEQMKKKLQSLSQQSSHSEKSSTSLSSHQPSSSDSHTSSRREGSQPVRFCFKCGKDGHHIQVCRSKADPVRVERRFEEARKEQTKKLN